MRNQRDGSAQSLRRSARFSCRAQSPRESDSGLERAAGRRCPGARIARRSSGGGSVAKLGIEGLLCAEFFVTRTGELFVNELAPRPHNSYHQSERGCATSQFEQLVRAVCNLPLGSTELIVRARLRICSAICGWKGARFCCRTRSAGRAAASIREAHAARGTEDGASIGGGSNGGGSTGAGAGSEAASLGLQHGSLDPVIYADRSLGIATESPRFSLSQRIRKGSM